MSERNAWAEICDCEKSAPLTLDRFYSPTNFLSISPIDEFYINQKSFIKLGTAEALSRNDALGRLLLLGIVSATETYFRNILSGLVYICPLAHVHAYVQQLSFGSVDYYLKRDLGLALLENHSLLSTKEITSQTQRILSLEIKSDASLLAAVNEFDKLCNLRHAAVHSHGALAPINVQKLGLSSATGRLSLSIDLDGFQEATEICLNVVRAYNRFVYRETVERWISNGVLTGTWVDDKGKMEALFNLAKSSEDAISLRSAFLSYQKLLPNIKKFRLAQVARAANRTDPKK